MVGTIGTSARVRSRTHGDKSQTGPAIPPSRFNSIARTLARLTRMCQPPGRHFHNPSRLLWPGRDPLRTLITRSRKRSSWHLPHPVQWEVLLKAFRSIRRVLAEVDAGTFGTYARGRRSSDGAWGVVALDVTRASDRCLPGAPREPPHSGDRATGGHAALDYRARSRSRRRRTAEYPSRRRATRSRRSGTFASTRFSFAVRLQGRTLKDSFQVGLFQARSFRASVSFASSPRSIVHQCRSTHHRARIEPMLVHVKIAKVAPPSLRALDAPLGARRLPRHDRLPSDRR